MAKARLLINYATSDLGAFEQVAASGAALAERYEVRLVVSHFPHPDRSQRIDLGDPYLEYAVNFPDLFRFAPPDAVAPFVDGALVEENVHLAQQKLAVLQRYGLRGAFVGREP